MHVVNHFFKENKKRYCAYIFLIVLLIFLGWSKLYATQICSFLRNKSKLQTSKIMAMHLFSSWMMILNGSAHLVFPNSYEAIKIHHSKMQMHLSTYL